MLKTDCKIYESSIVVARPFYGLLTLHQLIPMSAQCAFIQSSPNPICSNKILIFLLQRALFSFHLMSLCAIWDDLFSFLVKVNQNLMFLHPGHPEPEIRGKAGLQKKCFQPFGSQFALKTKGPLPWIRHCTQWEPLRRRESLLCIF